MRQSSAVGVTQAKTVSVDKHAIESKEAKVYLRYYFSIHSQAEKACLPCLRKNVLTIRHNFQEIWSGKICDTVLWYLDIELKVNIF